MLPVESVRLQYLGAFISSGLSYYIALSFLAEYLIAFKLLGMLTN